MQAAFYDRIGPALRDGILVHNIAERLPLEDIAQAHELLEAGQNVGNVLLKIP